MEVHELNPHIRYARVHNPPFNHKNEVSICYDARFFYLENAGGSLEIFGKKYNISSKTAIYLPPLSEYRFFIDYTEETRVVTVDFDLVTDFAHIKSSLGTANKRNFDPSVAPKYELPTELSAPIIRVVPEIAGSLARCAANFINRQPLYRERSSALLKLCLLELLSRSEEYAYSELCERILAYVRESYADVSVTNESIAERFSYHPYHLNRVVKRETGKSLRAYIIYYRLEMAKNLLLTTGDSISEIAFRTGFSTSAHFIKIFREKLGLTPGEYRKNRLHTEI